MLVLLAAVMHLWMAVLPWAVAVAVAVGINCK